MHPGGGGPAPLSRFRDAKALTQDSQPPEFLDVPRGTEREQLTVMQAASPVISGRVLFVDDEAGILSALKRVFRRESYEIETASDGAAGLEVFRRFRPAVVVSDYRMPGMSGVEFLAKAREIDPESVRLILTGCTDLPAAEAAINQGEVWRFLTKPWNEGDLRATVASANERFKLIAENRVLLDKLAAIGLLAGGVAHELNNPIGGILAYAQILRKEVGSDSAIVADLKSIEDAALRAKRIVSDLLDFARSSKSMERGPIALTSVAQKAVALAKFQLRDISVELEAGESAPILGDANRLQQVVLNLLSNALDAVGQARRNGKAAAGHVVVRTWKQGADACLSVTDDGTGISEDARAKVFDAFFTTKERGKGTGLGLAVSTGIVRDHGGKLELTSKENEGTTFTVTIPALPTQSN